MTLLDIIRMVVPYVITIGAMFIIYGQYIVLKDRADYKRKHGIDPWRHGWEKDDKQN